MKIGELKQSVSTNEILIMKEGKKPSIKSMKLNAPNAKRGMFRAPPSDLIDSLCQEESTKDISSSGLRQSSHTPKKYLLSSRDEGALTNQSHSVHMGNYMTERPESKSRSRTRIN